MPSASRTGFPTGKHKVEGADAISYHFIGIFSKKQPVLPNVSVKNSKISKTDFIFIPSAQKLTKKLSLQ